MDKSFIPFKYRLVPTKEQEEILTNWCSINRFTWNYFLEQNIKKYETTKKFIFYNEMCKQLPKLKQAHIFLKQPPSSSIQAICQRLETSIQRVYKNNNGFPKFKSKKNNDFPSVYIPQIIANKKDPHIYWTKESIHIPKLGDVKWSKHCSLRGRLLSISIKFEVGYWWIVCLCENKHSNKISKNQKQVGIDLGLKNWITTSDNEIFNLHPKLILKEQKVIKQQKKLSKKQKGSKNRLKQKLKLQKAHFKVRCARTDNAHKISTTIAKKYSYVAMKDLNIKGMMKNRNLARKITQVSWGQLKTYLNYKTNVLLVSRWFPSTQLCSCCGSKQKMSLDKRIYNCFNCGLKIDRDLNAAINIKKNTFETKGIYACGDTTNGVNNALLTSYVSSNQEKLLTKDRK